MSATPEIQVGMLLEAGRLQADARGSVVGGGTDGASLFLVKMLP